MSDDEVYIKRRKVIELAGSSGSFTQTDSNESADSSVLNSFQSDMEITSTKYFKQISSEEKN